MTPRPMWATVEWGGKRIETASNIVFSNGLFDPWCGVLLAALILRVSHPSLRCRLHQMQSRLHQMPCS